MRCVIVTVCDAPRHALIVGSPQYQAAEVVNVTVNDIVRAASLQVHRELTVVSERVPNARNWDDSATERPYFVVIRARNRGVCDEIVLKLASDGVAQDMHQP